MDLKISKKDSASTKWTSRWINNVNTARVEGKTIVTADFKGTENTYFFDPTQEWVTEVKYYNIFKPEGADDNKN
jgi:hypothetical protein